MPLVKAGFAGAPVETASPTLLELKAQGHGILIVHQFQCLAGLECVEALEDQRVAIARRDSAEIDRGGDGRSHVSSPFSVLDRVSERSIEISGGVARLLAGAVRRRPVRSRAVRVTMPTMSPSVAPTASACTPADTGRPPVWASVGSANSGGSQKQAACKFHRKLRFHVAPGRHGHWRCNCVAAARPKTTAVNPVGADTTDDNGATAVSGSVAGAKRGWIAGPGAAAAAAMGTAVCFMAVRGFERTPTDVDTGWRYLL